MNEEWELKFQLPVESSGPSRISQLLGEPECDAILVSHYFDTADHVLFRKGCSLRIREEGGGLVQTAKWRLNDELGLLVRGEKSRKLSTTQLEWPDGTPLVELLQGKFDEVDEVANVTIHRRIWNVCQDKAQVEVAFDEGQIRTDKRRGKLIELELELKAGHPKILFRLASMLRDKVSLRLSVLSKYEAAMALAKGHADAHKSGPVLLSHDMDVATMVGTIIHSCLCQYRQNEDILLQKANPDAVHQARVAIRRMRSALKMFRPILHGRKWHWIDKDLRWLAQLLGSVRDLDVAIAEATDQTLLRQLKNARKNACSILHSALQSPRPQTLMLEIFRLLTIGSWRKNPQVGMVAAKCASTALDKLARKVRKLGRAERLKEPGDYHALRKATKALRYGSEFFALLFDDEKQRKRRIRYLAVLEKLQDELGEYNDLMIRPLILAQFGIVSDTISEADANLLLETSNKAIEDFSKAKPFWR